ncbi:3-dehydroquinate synthase [Dissulfurispira thermophila]|uniref:3-dehydroquinate synthase n=3 Tax=root TaxID=1 RepID=A0A7G1H4K3_9BACT|nr:3-dehydroquinate synthase [Dissulfurispira thermophila]BCB97139.1 3-dehydroquinate synthase [Dissulfurispira thermophila]
MQTVRVELGERSYDIVIDSEILSNIGERIKVFGFSKVAVVSNPTVFDLYGDIVIDSIKNAGFEVFNVIIPDGEEYKNFNQTYQILTELLKNKLDRYSGLIALGGGVIGDITGFVASIYMRGIHFIQIPTTLLSQVDSSVGGKTGVNHELGKNMIGTFYQPRLVWIDIDTLKTLPKREILCGIAEIIKYGVIWDERLFEFLVHNRDSILMLDREHLMLIIRRSCEIKAEVVSADERETGLRAILNYGHTIGHAVETETGYKRFLHGEAVAIGMNIEAKIAELMGFLNKRDAIRIKSVIDSYGLPSELPKDIDLDRLVLHMKLDKKVEAGEMKFIIPEGIGKVKIQRDVSIKVIRKALGR